jgi:hypothetical protein
MADLEFTTFVAKVAADLGMSIDQAWEPAWNGVRITDGLGHGYLLAQVRGNAGRVEVWMVFPPTRYWFGDDDRNPITCARARGPEAVAADIARRLAPRYEALLAKCAEWDAQRDAEDSARLSLARAIAAAFPAGAVSWPSHLQSEGRTQLHFYGPGHYGGNVRMSGSADYIEIKDLRVPRSVAVAMLTIFARVCDPREGR